MKNPLRDPPEGAASIRTGGACLPEALTGFSWVKEGSH